MIINFCKTFIQKAIIISVLLTFFPVYSYANLNKEVDSFLDGVSMGNNNSTAPSSWKGKDAEYYSMGSFYARSNVKNIQPVAVRLPELRAGCAGIDIFAGGFSFISSDQFASFFKAVGANAAGFTAKMGIALLCPMCEDIMSELQKTANEINSFNINSCETAKNAVGALAGLNDTTSRAFCKTKGNSTGKFNDYVSARAGCDNENQASQGGFTEEQKNLGAPPLNLVWKVLKQDQTTVSDDDKEYYELLMTMAGTIIMRNPSETPQITFKKPLAKDEKTIEILMNGGTLTVLKCNDATDCINPTEITVTISEESSFKGRVKKLISGIREKIIQEQYGSKEKFTNAEQQFLNNSPFGMPLLKMIETQQAYKKFDTVFSLDGLEDWLALNLIYQFLNELVNKVETYSYLSPSIPKDLKDAYIASIISVRQNIYKETEKVSYQINSLNHQVEMVEKVENYMNSKGVLTGIKQRR